MADRGTESSGEFLTKLNQRLVDLFKFCKRGKSKQFTDAAQQLIGDYEGNSPSSSGRKLVQSGWRATWADAGDAMFANGWIEFHGREAGLETRSIDLLTDVFYHVVRLLVDGSNEHFQQKYSIELGECLFDYLSLESVGQFGPNRLGRPSDTDPDRDEKMSDQWKSGYAEGKYKIYADMAEESGIPVKEIKRAIDRNRKRQ